MEIIREIFTNSVEFSIVLFGKELFKESVFVQRIYMYIDPLTVE